MSTFKTDAPVRTSLNTGLLPAGNRSGRTGVAGGAGREPEPSSNEYLDRFEEELHKRVDAEVESLVTGLEECVALAKVGNKDKFKAAQDALETELKAESMVRATENLLSLSHTLKLLFLLNLEDEGSAAVQKAQREHARTELQEAKEKARRLLADLLAKQ